MNESWKARRNLLGAQYRLYLTNNEKAVAENKEKEISQFNAVKENLDAINKVDKEESEIIATTKEMLNSLESVRSDIITYKSSDDEEQNKKAIEQLDKFYIPIVDKIDENLLLIANDVNQQVAHYANVSGDRYFIFLIFILLVLTWSAFMTYSISRQTMQGILKLLGEVGEALNKLAEGDLSFELQYQSENEFGELAEKIRISRNKLQKYIKNIDEVLGNLAKKTLQPR